MQVRKAGGRRYTDPDLIALIDSSYPPVDLKEFVRSRVKELLATLREFEGGFDTPLQRMFALASMAGYQVREMEMSRALRETRDAVFVPTKSPGRRGLILYNPLKTPSRIIHTIAHEIVHSFFPNSSAGAQFRSLGRRNDGPPPELEQLCDFGAAELTMPHDEFRQAALALGTTLKSVDALKQQFGTSYEATAYRIATTSEFPVSVGLFCHRASKARTAMIQATLFDSIHSEISDIRYRRQSFHSSQTYPRQLVFPWNKSLPEESVAYTAAKTAGVVSGMERLPVKAKTFAQFGIEAVVAPYQPAGTRAEWPNILVMFRTS